MITVSDAITRCAGLSRDCDSARLITRVTVTRDGELLTVAACDGYNALRYDFVLRDGRIDDWQPGTWTAPGASFPRWGSRPWAIRGDACRVICEPLTASGKASKRPPSCLPLDPGRSAVLDAWSTIAAALPERRDLSIDGWSEMLELLADDAPIEICGVSSKTHIRAGVLRADMGGGPYVPGFATVPAGKLAAAIEALDGATDLRLFLGGPEREPVVIQGRNPELDGDVYAVIAQLN